jgi:hypothetical protein
MAKKKMSKKRGRGRPRKPRPSKIIWTPPDGVRHIALRSSHSQANTHRWIAFKNGEVLGYFKTPEDASKVVEATP